MECESATCNVYEALDKLFTGEQNVQPSSFVGKLRETFPDSVRRTWPSIHSESASQWKSGPVMVRARCMVQDSLGSEFYAASCEVSKGDSKRVVSGVLRDSFGDESVTNTFDHGARHCYVMVPIPGATEWFERHFDQDTVDGSTDMKRLKLEPAVSKRLEKFVAKFIDDAAEELRVNRVLDVYGVMSGHGFGENPEMDGEQEDQSSSTNLVGVPNLHVIHYEEVKGLPQDIISSLSPSSSLPRLRSLLVDCVGDELAADYLAMHLISSTYARADDANICALPLNVCGVREASGIEQIVKALAPKVKVLPLTSFSLSSSPFHSVKCYKTNRLQQGELQLADGTHLIIDETVTPQGKVEVSGHAEANLSTLHKVISEQKIEYEFGFYRCPFEVDVPVMVLSEERSRFVATPYRICLPSGPAPSAAPIDKVAAADLLDIRHSLIHAKTMLKEVNVSGDVAKSIQEEFVAMCADPANGLLSDMKAEKLSQLLIVTRLVTVLRGHTEMTIDSWKVAVLMEKRREEELNARFPVAPTAADFAAENKEN
ncbi:hypothetical protein PFISCL1PPCAC_1199 [Pristionchus fissidentatus]|uniref:Mini-chromosome maintenance complex-binding protein n=1 Tax=Pristionchus fissidentatus TaxID=1538716 RepID=A0AAV5UTJ4_9BILA|nr:hypothetical protein PFISCL1PPCAC_1199 [Pristionchus fissidentatus]